jgi:hypothetical protein
MHAEKCMVEENHALSDDRRAMPTVTVCLVRLLRWSVVNLLLKGVQFPSIMR